MFKGFGRESLLVLWTTKLARQTTRRWGYGKQTLSHESIDYPCPLVSTFRNMRLVENASPVGITTRQQQTVLRTTFVLACTFSRLSYGESCQCFVLRRIEVCSGNLAQYVGQLYYGFVCRIVDKVS